LTRILVTGGTGFIGANLVEDLLDDGHAVTVLGRDAGRIRLKFGSRARVALWSHPDNPAWSAELGSHDVIVNLAGAQAVGTRFTQGSKQQIRESRVKTTRHLVEALERSPKRPRQMISASAVGFYGPQSPGVELDESSPVGSGFLAEVCHEWESAVVRATDLGVNVAVARIGVVLGPGGGALHAMARPFRLGLGGRIGNGRQDISFISLADAVRALRFCIDNPTIAGPVNVTAPAAVTGREMAAALGKVLHRPNWVPVPGLALRALYGEGAEALVSGQRAMPKSLMRAGFRWDHPSIEQTLTYALKATARDLNR
jgi:uncharacterized protein